MCILLNKGTPNLTAGLFLSWIICPKHLILWQTSTTFQETVHLCPIFPCQTARIVFNLKEHVKCFVGMLNIMTFTCWLFFFHCTDISLMFGIIVLFNWHLFHKSSLQLFSPEHDLTHQNPAQDVVVTQAGVVDTVQLIQKDTAANVMIKCIKQTGQTKKWPVKVYSPTCMKTHHPHQAKQCRHPYPRDGETHQSESRIQRSPVGQVVPVQHRWTPPCNHSPDTPSEPWREIRHNCQAYRSVYHKLFSCPHPTKTMKINT